MNKKILFIISAIVVVGILIYFFLTGGEGGFSVSILSFETVGSDKETVKNTSSVDDLEDGCFYVWHNDKADDITEDLENATSLDVFRLCPAGDKNWDKDTTSVEHVLWFDSSSDMEIPTLYEGDELLYVSSTEIPFEGISWERYADYGYSIGVANLISDESGHYHISNSDGEGYVGYIYEKSDAAELNQYTAISNLFLDKVGKSAVRDSLVSDGGTVANLEKDGAYVCEWYTGSFYQDFEMAANVHPFCAFETYTTYDYEFLHSSCISISIPEWFKTGYYYANGIGLFRYVKGSDGKRYNGEAYDSSIDWNEPIIIKDDNGNVLYDPSTGYTSPALNGEDIYSDEKDSGQIHRKNPSTDENENMNNNNEEKGSVSESDGDAGIDELQEGEYVIP